MADDLRSTLEAAVATVEKQAAPAPAPAPAPSPAPAPAPEPSRTDDKSAPTDVPPKEPTQDLYKPEGEPAAKTDAPKDKPEDTNAPPSTESPDQGPVRAPQSWKPVAKAAWDKLPAEVRSEVVRREREVTRALSETAGARKFAQGFQEVVKPFAPRYQQANVPPLQAIRSLMYMDHMLATSSVADKAQFAAKLLKDYQVDIQALDLALSGEDPSTAAPEAVIDRIVSQRMAPLQEFVQTQRQQAEQAQQREFQRTVDAVEAMASDPKYPDFDTVREDMADLIEINSRRGVYLTAEQAYTRAVAMNPVAQEAARERSKQVQAQQANGAAQRALGASLSVSGNPSALRTQIPATDLRGTIEAAVAAASGR